MLRADPSYPTVALFHVSLTHAEKKSETACSRVTDELDAVWAPYVVRAPESEL
ncbi:hypothetical protein EMIHUDRAFT_228553 [Emiliania huxleyi CCMP1516]|uniref:Uncharacterized protein n=2 Tax=Emiliania huxleyi TaxID=2903 RepID=A0A0D3KFN3_EMIH1|nr:hypothetical protein EMIHUDRAFT_228553 [Emiliania huxleyi CCMP1516]EOD34568.1 hypothetical protein EMIHUDRAFT_228553 [Emiliania huxleyi CCMP1516]|eukprot:XP_005786997.1 hypothetical protein EMIHUDRAFT_228553 [Emiliania huxleyi CCMP1516]